VPYSKASDHKHSEWEDALFGKYVEKNRKTDEFSTASVQRMTAMKEFL